MSKKDFVAKVLADGKITIPVEQRDQLGLKEGTFVKVRIIGKMTLVSEETK